MLLIKILFGANITLTAILLLQGLVSYKMVFGLDKNIITDHKDVMLQTSISDIQVRLKQKLKLFNIKIFSFIDSIEI